MTTPNEPNKARTIPLHIADQAVAACEAEIQKLKEENARLKGEDYAYNELGSLVPRHLLEHWMNESASLKAEVERLKSEPEDGWVRFEDYAALKAEVERLKGIILAQSSDFVRSKTADDGIKPEGHNDLAGRAIERCLELQAEVERLSGEVNRLYFKSELLVECGDEMANRAGQECWPSWVVADWNAAKEGKQS